MKKRNVIFFLIIVIILCIGLTPKELENDTFYTIKVGESIINNGIDMIDHFSIHNLSYTYPHWLYDILIYKIYKNFNFTGIYISNIILYIITILSIYHITYNLIKNKELSIFISILSIILISPFIMARAQLISTILLLHEIYFIEKLINTNKKKYIIYLVIISYLIATIHIAVYPMYYILYLPYLVSSLFTKIKLKLNSYNNKIKIDKNINTKLLIITIIISILLGFLTPLKYLPFTYTFKTLIGNSTKYINEHQPLILIKRIDVLVLTTITLIIITFTKTKIKLHDLFMLLGLFIVSLSSERHIFLLIVLGSISFCRLLSNFFKIEQDKSLNIISKKITTIHIMIIILILIALYSYNNYLRNDKPYINTKLYPVKASNYIIDNLDINNIRLYNDYNYGSYLIYRNIPVFIDSRCDLYLPEFNKHTNIFNDYIELPNNYNKIFKKYNISYILLNKHEYLNIVLNVDSKYSKIYEDNYFIIYERLDKNEKEI